MSVNCAHGDEAWCEQRPRTLRMVALIAEDARLHAQCVCETAENCEAGLGLTFTYRLLPPDTLSD